MAHLRNRNAPASAPGGLKWDSPESVVEVEDGLANELLHIASAGFSEVLPGDPDHPDSKQQPRRGRPTKTPITE